MLMKILYAMVILGPIAIILQVTGIGGDSAIFITSGLALVPLAGILGRATEEVAIYTGPNVGALLNATFGNAAELIITIVALREGLVGVVKATIAGSVIGNILVVLGFAMLIGGLKHGKQQFDSETAGLNATMMVLAVAAMIVPAIFNIGAPEHRPSFEDIEFLSDGVAVVLIIIYVLYLFFMLRRENSSSSAPETEEGESEEPTMGLPIALGLLAGTTIAVVVLSEILVGVIEPVAQDWGLTELFIGVMLVPLVGNVAEHLVAVQAAYRNKMDLSLGIALGSGIQVAIFVAPVLVLVSQFVGPSPITLVFNSFELTALLIGSAIAVLVSLDGESNWLEGAELIALYTILGIAFFFVP